MTIDRDRCCARDDYSAATLDPTNSVCRFLTFAAVCA
jgi:hypothetical protein